MKTQEYVIYLDDSGFRLQNDLGYWTGETYTHHGSIYLICETFINEKVKIYKSKKRAENAAEKLKSNYGVPRVEVQPFKEVER